MYWGIIGIMENEYRNDYNIVGIMGLNSSISDCGGNSECKVLDPKP